MNSLKRIVGPAALSTGTIHTVPDLHTQTLRWVKILNPSAGPITAKLGIGGTADANLIAGPVTIGAGESYREYMHCTMEAGETLQANVSGAGCTVVINGIDQN
jgi:hypothetical protein